MQKITFLRLMILMLSITATLKISYAGDSGDDFDFSLLDFSSLSEDVNASKNDKLTNEMILEAMKGGSKPDPEYFSKVETYALEANHPSLDECFNGKIPSLVKNIIETLKNPARFAQKPYGCLEKNLLLYGPPGTGKTTVAQIIAKETGRKLFGKNAGTFQTVYQASEVASIKNIFDEAKKYGKPCVIFIDEIDAIMAQQKKDSRGDGNKTLKALIGHLDSIKGNNNIYVIATTNNLEILDAPNADRFFAVELPAPKPVARKNIIQKYFDLCGIYESTDPRIEEIEQLALIHKRNIPVLKAQKDEEIADSKLVISNNNELIEELKLELITLMKNMLKTNGALVQDNQPEDDFLPDANLPSDHQIKRILQFITKIMGSIVEMKQMEFRLKNVTPAPAGTVEDTKIQKAKAQILIKETELQSLQASFADLMHTILNEADVFADNVGPQDEKGLIKSMICNEDSLTAIADQIMKICMQMAEVDEMQKELKLLEAREDATIRSVDPERIISDKFFNFFVKATHGLTGRSLKTIIKDAAMRLDNDIEIAINKPSFTDEAKKLWKLCMFDYDFRDYNRDFFVNYWSCSKNSLIEKHLYACIVDERLKMSKMENGYQKAVEKNMQGLFLMAKTISSVASVVGVGVMIQQKVVPFVKKFLQRNNLPVVSDQPPKGHFRRHSFRH